MLYQALILTLYLVTIHFHFSTGAKVTITDTKEGLESTRINVGRNTRNVRHAPLVKQLKWGDDLHMYPTSDHYDYILGADIIYIGGGSLTLALTLVGTDFQSRLTRC